jgi:hypothetical protein
MPRVDLVVSILHKKLSSSGLTGRSSTPQPHGRPPPLRTPLAFLGMHGTAAAPKPPVRCPPRVRGGTKTAPIARQMAPFGVMVSDTVPAGLAGRCAAVTRA